jgi:hypothetical protein
MPLSLHPVKSIIKRLVPASAGAATATYCRLTYEVLWRKRRILTFAWTVPIACDRDPTQYKRAG